MQREEQNELRTTLRLLNLNLAETHRIFCHDRNEDLIESEINKDNIGINNYTCSFCKSRNFKSEQLRICCQSGKVNLPNFIETPYQLKELIIVNHDQSNKIIVENFKENIRIYNNCFAFASIASNLIKPDSIGPYCFKIQGQMYHRASSLYPNNDNERRKFGQIYILDTQQAMHDRMLMFENNFTNIQNNNNIPNRNLNIEKQV